MKGQGRTQGRHLRYQVGALLDTELAYILWPPGGKNRLTGKDPDAGKD